MDLANAMRSAVGNLAPGDLYPDYPAPIVRHGLDGERELAIARWAMPSSKKALLDAATKRADKLRAKGKDVDFPRLLEMEPDSGTTKCAQHHIRALEAVAGAGQPLPCPVHGL